MFSRISNDHLALQIDGRRIKQKVDVSNSVKYFLGKVIKDRQVLTIFLNMNAFPRQFH